MTSAHSLEHTLRVFENANLQGVAGVIKIDSRQPGPVLGITACNHGDEPSGLAAFDFLLNDYVLSEKISRGIVYLVVNNLQAVRAYFEGDRHFTHYIDVDMSRLPDNVLEFTESRRSEVRRAIALYPIWKRFSVGLDLNSATRLSSEPAVISRGSDFPANLVAGFPIRKVVSDIDKVQWKTPAYAFYGGLGSDTRVLAIETGQIIDTRWYEIAKISSLALIRNLGMVNDATEGESQEYEQYTVFDKVTFSDLSYDFVRSFKSFESVKQKEELAKNTAGKTILAPTNGHILFATDKKGADKDLSEEMAFLSHKMQTHTA